MTAAIIPAAKPSSRDSVPGRKRPHVVTSIAPRHVPRPAISPSSTIPPNFSPTPQYYLESILLGGDKK
jgi:hypothetical protein